MLLHEIAEWRERRTAAMNNWAEKCRIEATVGEAPSLMEYGQFEEQMKDLGAEAADKLDELSGLVETFVDVWRDPKMLRDIGPHLACTEMDALHDLLTMLGEDWAATCLLDGHAAEDESGDRHYQGESEPVEPLGPSARAMARRHAYGDGEVTP